jgi:hypothetical protein
MPGFVRYALVAVSAFVVGTATVVTATAAGFPIGSLFFISEINGVATTPCSTGVTTGGTATTCNAVVDTKGQLSTSDADTHTALARNQYDSAGNLKVTGTTSVSGEVKVNNFPATQNVHVDNMTGFPVATQALQVQTPTPFSGSIDLPVRMNVTYAMFFPGVPPAQQPCTSVSLVLPNGQSLGISNSQQTLSLPAGGLSVDHISVYFNGTGNVPCFFAATLLGYLR